jgi:hypothetical protein
MTTFASGARNWTWTFIHDMLRGWLRYTEGRNVAPDGGHY